MEKKDINLIILVSNLSKSFIIIWDTKDGIEVMGEDEIINEYIEIRFTELDEFMKWGREYLANIDMKYKSS
ncbi:MULTISPECIES: hypothetical protein [Bacillus cereus group]|uniref:Uncharacterized protein n=1 Tax=Bacillus thuringiensis TaxID=1428 RepID=A0A9X7FY24_BACTU|nr:MULTISPECIES: hypothetical protein [Bacillus cereus group]PFT50784.1 hypothetical protein COK72_01915 [Bacillus thuringiensis]PFY22821.1 hypothetical protein COL44_18235 [Bacillus toyonensis]